MPELPEVETTLRGIKPHISAKSITDVIIRHPRLRWAIPHHLKQHIQGQTIKQLHRRGKYLLFEFANGTMLLHLGMSGRLCILPKESPPQKHDHVDIIFANKICLRFTDPRRFGALLWTDDVDTHPLLVDMGPEPLTTQFTGKYLFDISRNKIAPIKSFIMNNKIVVGVGNIYATEALFKARIQPKLAASKITLSQYQSLATAIKSILKKAIEKGGTTLKDFTKSDGSPGYFSLQLKVYGRGGQPCVRCDATLKSSLIGQRTTVYCPVCQLY